MEPAGSAHVVPVLLDGKYLRPEDIELRRGCSSQATRAVRIVRALIHANILHPVGTPEYETWFGIHAIIPATPAQLSVILNDDEPKRRGQRADPRRTPGSGGVGGFIMGLHLSGMKYDDIVELVYRAPSDWLPLPPLTDASLDRQRWLRADDDDDGDSDAARRRLHEVLRQLVAREAKAQGVRLQRGGRRS
jgi:hypothetical protein